MNIFRIDSGNPNGYVMAQAPALCYSKSGGIWTKNNDTLDTQGWVEILKEP